VAGPDPVAVAGADTVALARPHDVGDILAGADDTPAGHQSTGDQSAYESADDEPAALSVGDGYAGSDPNGVGLGPARPVTVAHVRPAVVLAERLTRAGAVGMPADPVPLVRLADIRPAVVAECSAVARSDQAAVVAECSGVTWSDQAADAVPDRRDPDAGGARLTPAGRLAGRAAGRSCGWAVVRPSSPAVPGDLDYLPLP
jgi:hypothetical protein